MISVSFEVQLPLPSGGLCSDDADVEVPENTTVADALAQIRKQFDINPSFSYIIAKLSYTASGTYLPMQIKETRLVRRNENYIVTFSSDTPITPQDKKISSVFSNFSVTSPKPKFDVVTRASSKKVAASSSASSSTSSTLSSQSFSILFDRAVASAVKLSNTSDLVRTPHGQTKCSLLTFDLWYDANREFVNYAFGILRPKKQCPFKDVDPIEFCNEPRKKSTLVLLANTVRFVDAEQLLRVAKAEGQRIMRDMVISQFPNRDYSVEDGQKLGKFFQAWTENNYFVDLTIKSQSRLFSTLRRKNFRDLHGEKPRHCKKIKKRTNEKSRNKRNSNCDAKNYESESTDVTMAENTGTIANIDNIKSEIDENIYEKIRQMTSPADNSNTFNMLFRH